MKDQRKPTPHTAASLDADTERSFAVNMRRLREKRGMSQAALARALEEKHGIRLDSTAITRIEKNADGTDGMRLIRLGEAAAIANVLGVELFEMLYAPRVGLVSQILAARKVLADAKEAHAASLGRKSHAQQELNRLEGHLVEKEIPWGFAISTQGPRKLWALIREWEKLRDEFTEKLKSLSSEVNKTDDLTTGVHDKAVDEMKLKVEICTQSIERLSNQLDQAEEYPYEVDDPRK